MKFHFIFLQTFVLIFLPYFRPIIFLIQENYWLRFWYFLNLEVPLPFLGCIFMFSHLNVSQTLSFLIKYEIILRFRVSFQV